MEIFFYIIFTILSFYVGVLFFRTLKLKEVEMTEEELKKYMIENNIQSKYDISYRKKYKSIPIGLPLWLLFLIIICSFIPILNIIFIIILIAITIILINNSYNNSFEKAFEEAPKLIKIIKFLNKKL